MRNPDGVVGDFASPGLQHTFVVYTNILDEHIKSVDFREIIRYSRAQLQVAEMHMFAGAFTV